MKTYNILKYLSDAKTICILTHKNPDADALGSATVLRNFLKNKLSAIIDIFSECDSIPENCLFITNSINPELNIKKYDCAIMVDCPNSMRLGKYENLYNSAKFTITIDHHITNNKSSIVNYIENVSSTCEIIYKILKEENYSIPNDDQAKLYAGIITDTNNFSVGNFNGNTMRIAGELIDNFDSKEIYLNFFSNNSKKHMNLLAKAIENAKYYLNDSILISHITKSEYKKLNLKEDDFTGIINMLATTSNVKLTCLIHPTSNQYYVSMRAIPNYDISIIAKNNGGGGHSGAAAYLSTNQIEEIESYIASEFAKLISNK